MNQSIKIMWYFRFILCNIILLNKFIIIHINIIVFVYTFWGYNIICHIFFFFYVFISAFNISIIIVNFVMYSFSYINITGTFTRCLRIHTETLKCSSARVRGRTFHTK
eukprot:Pompholyxophrys_sp_v1_NODE_9_length_5690_cov_16.428039.p6 type:complete len:108 gc:universal NODE_9_length_5690_cov_16.428039:2266-2589(+)